MLTRVEHGFKIFVGSAYAGDPVLQEVRAAIRFRAAAQGVSTWLFEYDSPTVAGSTPLSQAIALCLDQVSHADAYMGLIHNAYGGTGAAHVANLAFADLEIFHAIRLQKSLLLYVIEPSSRAAATDTLLTLLQHTVPRAFKGIGTAEDIVTWAVQDMLALTRFSLAPAAPRLSHFLDRSTRLRWRELTSLAGFHFTPGTDGSPTDMTGGTAEHLIHEMAASDALERSERVVALSALIPQLCTSPWEGGHLTNSHAVWDSFCERWRAATVWCDNHHSGPLGCLAISNTQLSIRCLQAMGDEAAVVDRLRLLELNSGLGSTEWHRVYGLGGAISSSCYSLGKQMCGGRRRSYLLHQALRWIAVARKLQLPDWQAAGLAAIAGHVYLAIRSVEEAVSEFEHSVALRQIGDEAASLAEARGDLGYLVAIHGDRRHGLRMVEDAVAQLCSSMGEGFASRMKLKLAELYLRRSRLRDALREVAEADAICRHHGISLRIPAAASARVSLQAMRYMTKRVDVAVDENGYRFER